MTPERRAPCYKSLHIRLGRTGQSPQVLLERLEIRIAARFGDRHRLATTLDRFLLPTAAFQRIRKAVPHVRRCRVELRVVPEGRDRSVELLQLELLVAELVDDVFRRKQGKAEAVAELRIVSLHVVEGSLEAIRRGIAREAPSGENHSKGIEVALDDYRIVRLVRIDGRVPAQGTVLARAESADDSIEIALHLGTLASARQEEGPDLHVRACDKRQQECELLPVIPGQPWAGGDHCLKKRGLHSHGMEGEVAPGRMAREDPQRRGAVGRFGPWNQLLLEELQEPIRIATGRKGDHAIALLEIGSRGL